MDRGVHVIGMSAFLHDSNPYPAAMAQLNSLTYSETLNFIVGRKGKQGLLILPVMWAKIIIKSSQIQSLRPKRRPTPGGSRRITRPRNGLRASNVPGDSCVLSLRGLLAGG
jgi:hypothetical protein